MSGLTIGFNEQETLLLEKARIAHDGFEKALHETDRIAKVMLFASVYVPKQFLRQIFVSKPLGVPLLGIRTDNFDEAEIRKFLALARREAEPIEHGVCRIKAAFYSENGYMRTCSWTMGK